MNKDEFVIYTDLGDGMTTLTPYGRSVDVSAEVRRWQAFGRRLVKRFLQRKAKTSRK
jgi:hypothetical protein